MVLKMTTTADYLLNSALDFIEHAPNAQFVTLMTETGRDVRALADIASVGIALALKRYGVVRRAALREQHAASKAAYSVRSAALAQTISEKLALIAQLLTDAAAAGMRTSLAHRNLSEMPEEELDRILVQLTELARKKD